MVSKRNINIQLVVFNRGFPISTFSIECPDKLDDVDLDSMAWLAYTSGTTGLSKAIVYNHRSVIGSISARE